jgi:hypothetical protein
MADNEKHNKEPASHESDIPALDVENARRKLVTKLAAGAFAVPTILAALSRTPAHASP